MLVVFLLLGIGPAVLTLTLTQWRTRDALFDRHRGSLGEALDSINLVLADRLSTADELAASLLADGPPERLIDASLGRFDRAARIQPGVGVEWLAAGRHLGLPPAALAKAPPPAIGKPTLVSTHAPGEAPSLWLLRRAPADGGLMAFRLSRQKLWTSPDDLPAQSSLCVFDAELQPLHCDNPLPETVTAGLAQARAGGISGSLAWEGAEPMTAIWREMFLKVRFGIEGWHLVLSQPTRVGEVAQARLAEAVIPVAAAALMIAVLLALGAVRRTLGPLHALTEATERLGARDFSQRIQVSENTEFAVLGDAFNRLADGLSQQFDTLEALARIDRLILEGRPASEIGAIARELLAAGLPQAATIVAIDEAGDGRWRLYRAAGDKRQERSMPRPAEPWCDAVQRGRPLQAMRAGEAGFPSGLHPVRDGECHLVPVIADRTLAGCLTVARAPHRPPTQAETELLAGLAGRIAVAIAAARRARLLHQRANFDSLTGLPNRPHFLEQLDTRLALAQAARGRVDVLFVDLDGFSHINDSLGHAAGDRMLGEVGRRLRETLGTRGLVARLGGDEFALAISDAASDETARGEAQRVIDALARPFHLSDSPQFINASVGIASFPDQGEDAATLLRHADMAMYRAKARGQGSVAVYEASMQEAAIERARVESELRVALQRQEFVLHYEPLVEAASGRIVGCEALIRWRHPERGMVSPGVFIPVAEETGLISPIGSWVLREACRQFMQWQRDGVPVSVVSVNASVHQFQRPDFVDEVAQVLREAGMPASGLKLELTESLLMDEPREVERRLEALAAMGVSLALDDFGTGYSSLTYLKRLPVDSIKLDRSFVRDLLERDEARELARSAITMLHALRKQVVVEGVELQPQRELLAGWGADLLQGWLFSKSQPGDAFADYVRRAPVTPVAAGVAAAAIAAGTGPATEAGGAASVLVAGEPEALEKPLELLGA
jgi:diguanylate cyclase (GGDEF)-like protein